MKTIKIDGNLMAVVGISAITLFGLYKLTKLGIEADKKQEEERAAFKAEKEKLIKEKQYDVKIDLASLRNDALDADDRRHAYLMLTNELNSLRDSNTQEQLDFCVASLERVIDIFNRKDPEEIRASIDIYLAHNEAIELKKERDHELALAKAAGNIELEKAKIAANAETSKAKLYSNSISGAIKLGKEVLDNGNLVTLTTHSN